MTSTGRQGTSAEEGGARVLLDPTSERSLPLRERLARLTKLDGATIALLDIAKPRGDVFLDRLEQLFGQRGASVKRYRKPTFTKPAPMDVRHQIAEECAAVVEALAD